uniref:SfiI-subtelomeric related protein family member n=1 Tax=Theileria annulata TaxID=5874 RepID=A0A3B0MMG7_THEAN
MELMQLILLLLCIIKTSNGVNNGFLNPKLTTYQPPFEPIILDLRLESSTKVFEHLDRDNSEEYIAKDGYIFDVIVVTSPFGPVLQNIYKARDISNCAIKVIKYTFYHDITSVSLFLVNGDFKKLVKQNYEWVEVNDLKIDISNNRNIDTSMYVIQHSGSFNEVVKDDKKTRVFRRFHDYKPTTIVLINKVVETRPVSGEETVIWKTDNTLYTAYQVSICTYQNLRYLAILHKNYDYTLFSRENTAKTWDDITLSRLNMRELRFYFEDERDLSFVQQLSKSYVVYLNQFRYVIDFNFDQKLLDKYTFRLASNLQYNILEDTISVQYVNGLKVTLNPGVRNIKLYYNKISNISKQKISTMMTRRHFIYKLPEYFEFVNNINKTGMKKDNESDNESDMETETSSETEDKYDGPPHDIYSGNEVDMNPETSTGTETKYDTPAPEIPSNTESDMKSEDQSENKPDKQTEAKPEENSGNKVNNVNKEGENTGNGNNTSDSADSNTIVGDDKSEEKKSTDGTNSSSEEEGEDLEVSDTKTFEESDSLSSDSEMYSRYNESDDEHSKLIELDINVRKAKISHKYIRRDKYFEFSCISGYEFVKIYESSLGPQDKKEIWSTHDQNESVIKVMLLEGNHTKYLMGLRYNYRFFLYKWKIEGMTWVEITDKKVSLDNLRMIDVNGAEIRNPNIIASFHEFQLEVIPRITCHKIYYKSQKMWEDTEKKVLPKIDIIIIKILEDKVNIFFKNGQVKRFELYSDRMLLISQGLSTYESH